MTIAYNIFFFLGGFLCGLLAALGLAYIDIAVTGRKTERHYFPQSSGVEENKISIDYKEGEGPWKSWGEDNE